MQHVEPAEVSASDGPHLPPGASWYEETDVEPGPGGPDAFYDSAYASQLRRRVEGVLAVEAPIEPTLLARRVANAYGLQRVTPRVTERIDAILRSLQVVRTRAGDRAFLWTPAQDPRTYAGLRLAHPNHEYSRNLEEIAPEEVANAVVAVLRDHVSMEEDDLLRETCRLLGYPRLGATRKELMAIGLRAAQNRGQILRDGDRIRVG
jgi:hypothetical protein